MGALDRAFCVGALDRAFCVGGLDRAFCVGGLTGGGIARLGILGGRRSFLGFLLDGLRCWRYLAISGMFVALTEFFLSTPEMRNARSVPSVLRT